MSKLTVLDLEYEKMQRAIEADKKKELFKIQDFNFNSNTRNISRNDPRMNSEFK